ncbi:ABC transporter substrate-binding protein [Streptomyces chumphonensis]|uniref:ABC transporter substrate-binding protein n=1 Tax=Streptomyces chumphonensis TaxID=1214925 RepID=A0A927IDV2_9ACTN|nr:ABC transporter substrate-binding protein [Streptomyces chumphonensis]MBD3933044.1 ABC transporter substrate-binding protein [Streptomyces chumphonensis]
MTASREPRAPRPRLRTAVSAALAVAAAGTSLTGCGTLSAAENDPITVMTLAPIDTKATNMPGMTATATAYARWVNADGGINGRELKVVTCNEGNDGVQAAGCARKAREVGAVAVVGSYTTHARTIMPALELHGIPYLGGYGLTEEEFSSPLSYPVNGGQPALVAGSGRQLAEVCDEVALVRPDTIAGDELPGLFNAGLASRGEAGQAVDVPAPEDSAEYTREARTALRAAGVPEAPDAEASEAGPDTGTGPGNGEFSTIADAGGADGACVAATLGGRTGTFIDSFSRLRESSAEVTFASVLGSVEQSLVNRTGGADSMLEGSYVTSWYPASQEPVWDEMRAATTEHAFGDNRIDLADPGVQTTWVAYTVLRSVLEGMEGQEITHRTVHQALDATGPVSTGGITPDLSWQYEDLLGSPNYPRIVNSMVNFQQVRDGQLVAARPNPVDIGRTLNQITGG